MARDRIGRIAATRDELRGAERAAFEIGNGDIVRDLALMVPDPETRTREALVREGREPRLDAALRS